MNGVKKGQTGRAIKTTTSSWRVSLWSLVEEKGWSSIQLYLIMCCSFDVNCGNHIPHSPSSTTTIHRMLNSRLSVNWTNERGHSVAAVHKDGDEIPTTRLPHRNWEWELKGFEVKMKWMLTEGRESVKSSFCGNLFIRSVIILLLLLLWTLKINRPGSLRFICFLLLVMNLNLLRNSVTPFRHLLVSSFFFVNGMLPS